MRTSLASTTDAAPSASAIPDGNRRLRALREGQYPGLPTGWGRWPTCACPRESRSAEGFCS